MLGTGLHVVSLLISRISPVPSFPHLFSLPACNYVKMNILLRVLHCPDSVFNVLFLLNTLPFKLLKTNLKVCNSVCHCPFKNEHFSYLHR